MVLRNAKLLPFANLFLKHETFPMWQILLQAGLLFFAAVFFIVGSFFGALAWRLLSHSLLGFMRLGKM
jgi:hypothetical protein